MPDITTVPLEKLMNGASRRWREAPTPSPRFSSWTLAEAMEEERGDAVHGKAAASGTPPAMPERRLPLEVAEVLMQIRASHCLVGQAAATATQGVAASS